MDIFNRYFNPGEAWEIMPEADEKAEYLKKALHTAAVLRFVCLPTGRTGC